MFLLFSIWPCRSIPKDIVILLLISFLSRFKSSLPVFCILISFHVYLIVNPLSYFSYLLTPHDNQFPRSVIFLLLSFLSYFKSSLCFLSQSSFLVFPILISSYVSLISSLPMTPISQGHGREYVSVYVCSTLLRCKGRVTLLPASQNSQ